MQIALSIHTDHNPSWRSVNTKTLLSYSFGPVPPKKWKELFSNIVPLDFRQHREHARKFLQKQHATLGSSLGGSYPLGT